MQSDLFFNTRWVKFQNFFNLSFVGYDSVGELLVLMIGKNPLLILLFGNNAQLREWCEV